MRKLNFLFLIILFILFGSLAYGQITPLPVPAAPVQKGSLKQLQRCATIELLKAAIRNDPTLPEKWRAEGEKQYQLYLEKKQPGNQRTTLTEAGPIIIPIVFHIVDDAAAQAGITDRDIYEQVEILNRDYSGKKMDEYTSVIPPEIAARIGRIPVKFVLARRTPNGTLTTGIERRVTSTPDHISVKSTASGGLDAWDVTKYLNVWCGTFSGSENGLLGLATFPFTSGEGPQGVVIGTATLPYTSSATRNYYPNYSEGATLSHEIGHYFYLFHTFGDDTFCNNTDFGIQPGWPLPLGAGSEGDDTPSEKGTISDNFIYGNPTMNYSDGCATESFGMMYGSIMNYFDDRALFMFSEGMRKRVEGCIELYRPSLLVTDGATPPTAVTDAFLVNVSSRGLPERKSFIVNNTPLQAIVRNSGTTNLTSVTLNVSLDAGAASALTFPLSLPPGKDTTLNLAAVAASAGNHILTVYTQSPNGTTDNFLNNDTLQSFINILSGTATLPFAENFTSATFPPSGWQVFNPNSGTNNTWTRNGTSGFTAAGSAFVNNFNINQSGTLDELVSPIIDPGVTTSAVLSFKVANAVFDAVDVSTWDGLEVYVSGNGGKTYKLAYKKSGKNFTTVAATNNEFFAPPSLPLQWRTESLDLTPYLVSGQKLIIKFRNINSNGNNTFLDDINIVAVNPADAQISAIISPVNNSITACSPITATVTIKNPGVTPITSALINVNLNGVIVGSQQWTGNLASGASATVVLNSIAITPIPGNNILKIYTTLPNTVADINPANDTSTVLFTKTNGVTVPFTEGFESITFPPTGWTLNPSSGNTWQRVTPGSSSANSIKADFFNYSAGTTFSITTPYINVASQPFITIAFELAHRQSGSNADRLQVQVTNDCGANYITVYDKTSSTGLATTSSGAGAFIPVAADWRRDIISLSGS
ncbi:MAG: choice-of-anchor J domain-containing protein, partial [Bacteroidota bacterium]